MLSTLLSLPYSTQVHCPCANHCGSCRHLQQNWRGRLVEWTRKGLALLALSFQLQDLPCIFDEIGLQTLRLWQTTLFLASSAQDVWHADYMQILKGYLCLQLDSMQHARFGCEQELQSLD